MSIEFAFPQGQKTLHEGIRIVDIAIIHITCAKVDFPFSECEDEERKAAAHAVKEDVEFLTGECTKLLITFEEDGSLLRLPIVHEN